MGNILRSEFFKLKKNKAFKVVIIVALIYTLGSAFMFMGLGLMMNSSSEGAGINPGEVEGMPAIFGGLLDYMFNPKGATSLSVAMSSDGTILLIMITAVVCSIIVTDHQRGIMRNIMVSGNSRTKVYLSKLVVCIVVGTIVCLISTVIYFLINTIAFGFGSVSAGRFLLHFLLILLLFAAFSSLLMMLASITKSTAATIAISIALIIIFLVVFPVVAAVLPLMEVGESVVDIANIASELYVGALMPAATNFSISAAKLIQYYITAVATLGLTTLIGVLNFRKSDMK